MKGMWIGWPSVQMFSATGVATSSVGKSKTPATGDLLTGVAWFLIACILFSRTLFFGVFTNVAGDLH